jgi:hypothetical protein
MLMGKLKKGKVGCAFLLGAYRFLKSSNSSKAKTTTIAMIMPIDTGRKYMSATDAGVGVGAGVAAGASSTNKVKTRLLVDTTKKQGFGQKNA